MFGNKKEHNFNEKWEAQAFVLVCHLNELGYISWPEWTELLSKHLRLHKKNQEFPGNRPYYVSWLAAAEEILIQNRLVTSDELFRKKEDLQLVDLTNHH